MKTFQYETIQFTELYELNELGYLGWQMVHLIGTKTETDDESKEGKKEVSTALFIRERETRSGIKN